MMQILSGSKKNNTVHKKIKEDCINTKMDQFNKHQCDQCDLQQVCPLFFFFLPVLFAHRFDSQHAEAFESPYGDLEDYLGIRRSIRDSVGAGCPRWL